MNKEMTQTVNNRVEPSPRKTERPTFKVRSAYSFSREWWWTIYNILVSQLDKIVSPTQERTFSLYGGKHLSEVD